MFSNLLNLLIKEMITNDAYRSDYENITASLLFKPVDYNTAIKVLDTVSSFSYMATLRCDLIVEHNTHLPSKPNEMKRARLILAIVVRSSILPSFLTNLSVEIVIICSHKAVVLL